MLSSATGQVITYRFEGISLMADSSSEIRSFYRKRTNFTCILSGNQEPSKKKMDVVEETYSLDLCTITSRLMVMGTPFSKGLDSLKLIQAFLNSPALQGHYKIYNFSAEHHYNIDQDLDNVKL